jgi:hypothetical protein
MKYSTQRILTAAAVAALALLGAAPEARAQSVATFDFEAHGCGIYTALNCASNGVGLEVRRSGGFSVVDDTPFQRFQRPGSWGDRALAFFPNPGSSDFRLTFNTALQSVSVDVGDYGFGPDEVSVQALDAQGRVVGEAVGRVPAGQGHRFRYVTLALNAAPGATFQTLRLRGADGPLGHTLLWDNLRVTTAPASAPSLNPEPGGLSLLAAGLLGLVGIGWKRRAASPT